MIGRAVAFCVVVVVAALGLAAAAGADTLGPQTRVSTTAGNGADDADSSAVAYNPMHDQYFVVWDADPGVLFNPPLADNEGEIFGRLVDGDGSVAGPQIRISDAGPDN